jgi:hypothetical protein
MVPWCNRPDFLCTRSLLYSRLVCGFILLSGGESLWFGMRLENNSDINEYGILEGGVIGQKPDDGALRKQRYGAFTCLVVVFVLVLVLFILYANIETKKTIQV